MKCPICDSHDQWENIDDLRHVKKGMSICKTCGFVSYPSLYKTEEEIKEHYRGDRSSPTVMNLYTGEKKLHYHEAFLRDLLDTFNKDDKTRYVYEVGASMGLCLDWVKRRLNNVEVGGTELTKSFRRTAKWEFDIDLEEDFNPKREIDLMMSYKVAEHLLDVDTKLRQNVTHLSKGGLYYISVPIWFGSMYNFGLTGFDLEYYYHTNHVNVWTDKLFRTLLKKVGLEIIKEDHVMYDSTFLCKRNDDLMKEKPEYEDYNEIKEKMAKIKKASEFIEDNKVEEALKVWPDFPHAWQGFYELNRSKFHENGYEWIIENVVNKAIKDCPRSADMQALGADISLRYGKWQEAIKYLNTCLEMRPNNAQFLLALSHCFREAAKQSKEQKVKLHFISEARNVCRHLHSVNTQVKPEAINWIYKDGSQLPLPEEKNL